MSRLNIKTTGGKTITDAVWFTNPTVQRWKSGDSNDFYHTTACIGIVTLEWDNNYIKYIGVGKGISEEEDALLIVDWGSTFEGGNL